MEVFRVFFEFFLVFFGFWFLDVFGVLGVFGVLVCCVWFGEKNNMEGWGVQLGMPQLEVLEAKKPLGEFRVFSSVFEKKKHLGVSWTGFFPDFLDLFFSSFKQTETPPQDVLDPPCWASNLSHAPGQGCQGCQGVCGLREWQKRWV